MPYTFTPPDATWLYLKTYCCLIKGIFTQLAAATAAKGTQRATRLGALCREKENEVTRVIHNNEGVKAPVTGAVDAGGAIRKKNISAFLNFLQSYIKPLTKRLPYSWEGHNHTAKTSSTQGQKAIPVICAAMSRASR